MESEQEDLKRQGCDKAEARNQNANQERAREVDTTACVGALVGHAWPSVGISYERANIGVIRVCGHITLVGTAEKRFPDLVKNLVDKTADHKISFFTGDEIGVRSEIKIIKTLRVAYDKTQL